MRSFEIIVSLSLALGVSALAAPVNPRYLNTASPAEYNISPAADCEKETGVASPLATASQDISNPSRDNANAAIIPESASLTNFGGPVNQIPSSAVTTSSFSSVVPAAISSNTGNIFTSVQPNTLSLLGSVLNSFETGTNPISLSPTGPIQAIPPSLSSINVFSGNVPSPATEVLNAINLNAINDMSLPGVLKSVESIPTGINTLSSLTDSTSPDNISSDIRNGIIAVSGTVSPLANTMSKDPNALLQDVVTNDVFQPINSLNFVESIPAGINTNSLPSLTDSIQATGLTSAVSTSANNILLDGLPPANVIQNGVLSGKLPVLLNPLGPIGTNIAAVDTQLTSAVSTGANNILPDGLQPANVIQSGGGVLSGKLPLLDFMANDFNPLGSIGSNIAAINTPLIPNIVSDSSRLSFTDPAANNRNCICSPL